MHTPVPPRTRVENILLILGLLFFVEPMGFFFWVYFTGASVSEKQASLYFAAAMVGAVFLGVARGMETTRLRKHKAMQPSSKQTGWKKYLIK